MTENKVENGRTVRGNHKWEELRLPEFNNLLGENPVAVFPIGATEQHGPHLPEDTDTHIAVELAHEAARLAGIPVLVLPPLAYGCSSYHMRFAGTLTLSQDTFIAVVSDVCRSAWRHGVRNIVLLNAHGGNTSLLDTITRRLSDEGIWTVSLSWWSMIREQIARERSSEKGGMNHACELETSIELFLRPELVCMQDAIDEVVPPTLEAFGGDIVTGGFARYPTPLDLVSHSGVMGMPTAATGEKGERWFRAAAEAIAELLRNYRTADRHWEEGSR